MTDRKREVMSTEGATTRKDRRENRMSNSADIAYLEPPEWMDDVGQSYWKKFADLCYRAGVVTEMDYFGLETLVKLYREIRRLERDIASYGYSSPEGKSRPEVAALNAKNTMLVGLLKDFGMVPKGRGVVQVPKGEMDKRTAPGEEEKVTGFGKFKVIKGGGAVNKPDQRYSDRNRKAE